MSLRLEIEGITPAEAMGFIVDGLLKRRAALDVQIAAVTGTGTATPALTGAKTAKTPAKEPAKGQMSPEGRARIVAAQKKRWAEKRKLAKAAAKAQAAPAAEPQTQEPEPEPEPEPVAV